MSNNKNNSAFRGFALWFIIILVSLLFYEAVGGAANQNRISFSSFMEQIDQGNIKNVVLRGDVMETRSADNKVVTAFVPKNYLNLAPDLMSKGVKIEVLPLETPLGNLVAILLSWFPVILLVGVWVYFMKNMQGGAGKTLGFGRSRAQLITKDKNKITFKDIAGIEEAKEELMEIVEFLRDPRKFQRLGGKIPRGCLLVGQPGTGKTLLAKAIAGEAKVPFFSISGSEFVEMFVGVGASRVRDTFSQAKRHPSAIVFIDEIDAVGRHRGAGLGGGNDEREQTLNQLLVEMDGFTDNQGVIIIAATNRPDVLDPALLRPGRFDRQIVVPLPDINGREQIFKVHAAKVPLAPDVDLRVMARRTPGFSGADIANVINEAALLAARRNHNFITMQELEEAMDKVVMGVARKSIVIKETERKLTAYHEGGHALVTLFLAGDPIHKVTIVPRGGALGMVMQLPEDDRYSMNKEQFNIKIAIAMGGRAAEFLIFGPEKITSGAGSDIKAATNIARKMVTQWGLSDVVGPVLVGDDREEVFLGHAIAHPKSVSDHLAFTIDQEIRAIIDNNYQIALKILQDNIDKLHLLADTLLEKETLSGEEVIELLKIEHPYARKAETSEKKSLQKKRTKKKE